MRSLFFSGILAVLLFSCASSPVDIPPNLSVAVLTQKGQEAMDQNHYSRAVLYYQAILEGYPWNMEAVCSAEYEIAFIHYKQGRYDEARRGFRALLTRYTEVDAELLPAQYRILSEIVLERMEKRAPVKTEPTVQAPQEET
jgi:outer membrane protein assembly factor BamD (BamD/ComL family)